MSQWGQPGQFQQPMQGQFQQNPPQFQNPTGFQQQGFPGQQQQPAGFQQNPQQFQQNPQFQNPNSGFQQNPQQFQQQQRPTGFQQTQPTGFVQSQPTGFPGNNSFQARPAPPPPPVPQFSFLNAPPPPVPNRFGGGGLVPQATGFPGQQGQGFGGGLSTQPTGFQGLSAQPTGFGGQGFGGGMQPLMAQPTGFVDPRLQMMSSTFMPAPGGGFQGGGPAGGLQQAFQQQARAPKIPWALGKAEKKSYDSIFRAWTKGSNFISGETALEVFGQSGLAKDDLAQIWALADVDNRGKLNVAEFHVAMGLIYRKLNGNDIPETLPAELVPPSARDLNESVDFLKDLLREPSTGSPRAASPGGQVSYLRERSFNDSSSGKPTRDGTIYKHLEDKPESYYTPAQRHIDRGTIRTSHSPAGDLEDVKSMLKNTAAMLDAGVEKDKGDEELEEEMADLRYRVKRLQEDLDYLTRGPRSAKKDEQRRDLERQLLVLMHERVPEVERRMKDREERKAMEKRQWVRDRERRNERHGRYNDDRNRPYSSRDDERPYSRGPRDDERPYSRGPRDDDYRSRDDEYRSRDHDRPYSRGDDRNWDQDRREDNRSRGPRDDERPYSRNEDRRRSPERRPSPKPTSSTLTAPSPAASRPTPSPAPPKNMTPAERQAYARAQAMQRIEDRKRALGIASSPAPPPDTSVEDRLAEEKKEAEEKAAAAEREAENRERERRERLEREKSEREPKVAPTPTAKSVPPPAPTPKSIPKPAPKAPPPKVAPPPPKPRGKTPAFTPRPVEPEEAQEDPEEEAIRAREALIKKRAEERAARLKALEEEEEAARLEEERYEAKMKALREKEAKPKTPAFVPETRKPAFVPEPRAAETPASPPATSPAVTSPGEKSSTNPFSRLLNQKAPNGSAASTPTQAPASNPWASSTPAAAVPASKSPAPSSKSSASYQIASSSITDDWEEIHENNEDDDSDDDIAIGRGIRDDIASKLFGAPRPQSTGPGATSSAAASPVAPAAPPPPPAPSAPVAPPAPRAPAAPIVAAPVAPGGMSALLQSIQGGKKLKSVKTVDKSGPPVAGKVIGDPSPPVSRYEPPPDHDFDNEHLSESASLTPEPPSMSATSSSQGTSRQSVDWYAGLASDGVGAQSTIPTFPTMASTEEEDEEDLVHVPEIQVTSDLMADIDMGTDLKVRTLYPFEGEGADDLSFPENVILKSHPSKTGDWWYGTFNGRSGMFPKIYVQEVLQVAAKALYAYEATKDDEMTFEEGDSITLVDQSPGDWWMAEKSGKVLLVPAAYLEADIETDSRERKEPTQDSSRPASSSFQSPSDVSPDPDPDSSEDDTSSSGFLSFDDSDSDSDDDLPGYPESKAEREARAHERQLVLEAAGLIVKNDMEPPPSRTGSVRRTGPQGKRRPAPAAPRKRTSSAKDLPPLPETDHFEDEPTIHLNDAFDRYESFRQMRGNRLSVSSIDVAQLKTELPPLSPTTSQTPSLVSQSGSQSGEGRSYSQLLNFLGRSKTPNEGRKTPGEQDGRRPVISAPILNPPSEDSTRSTSPAFGSSWASLVDKTALEGIPASDRRRQEAIFELIATENAYVRDLQLIVEVFYSSMMPMLDRKGITVVFANVEDILLTNTDYCVNQSNAIKVLKSLRDSNPELGAHLLVPSFAHWYRIHLNILQRLREDPTLRNLDLSSFLLIPMQRITRYPLLIRQILNYTEPGPEQTLIQESLATAEKILDRINEAIRDQEGYETLKTISQHLWIGQGRLDLTAPTRHMGTRRLLKQGVLMKIKMKQGGLMKGRGGRKLHAFLCSDILVLTDETMKNLYRMPIALSEAKVKDLPGGRDDLAFQVVLPYTITLIVFLEAEMTDPSSLTWYSKGVPIPLPRGSANRFVSKIGRKLLLNMSVASNTGSPTTWEEAESFMEAAIAAERYQEVGERKVFIKVLKINGPGQVSLIDFSLGAYIELTPNIEMAFPAIGCPPNMFNKGYEPAVNSRSALHIEGGTTDDTEVIALMSYWRTR
ncbi:hypothetical protein C8J56DRAFT_887202 [Mycena floridula]|nr:hypothetical protein C8J56DRAFT_887202 [Mycena floridula]